MNTINQVYKSEYVLLQRYKAKGAEQTKLRLAKIYNEHQTEGIYKTRQYYILSLYCNLFIGVCEVYL